MATGRQSVKLTIQQKAEHLPYLGLGLKASLLVQQQEDEAAADEEEEEDDEDMEEGDEGIRRYPLRDRAKAQVQPYVPGTGGGMLRRAGCAAAPCSHSHSCAGRQHGMLAL